jgi:hypothetical protein
MRLPKVRFTIGQIMILVAVLGCTLAIGLATIKFWEESGSPTVGLGPSTTVVVSTTVVEWEEIAFIEISSPCKSLGFVALTILGIGSSIAFWIQLSRWRRIRRNA